MAKTYDPAQILTDETYQVRFLIGDTDVGTPPSGPVNRLILYDEEIDWLISTEANVYMAAAAAADKIVLMMSSSSGSSGLITRKRVGQTDISYANGRTSKEYTALASVLRARGRSHQVIFAGGISQADKDARDLDTDRPTNRIRTGQFDSIDAMRES